MAARRPKDVSAWLGGNRGTVQSGGGRPTGIVDDIAKGIKDIASPWLPAAPGQNRSVTQAQGLARATAETLDQTVTGGLVKAGVQGNKALAKQAAINAAALGAGYVAGKAIQSGVSAVRGTYLGVHGSPTQGLSSINNQIGARSVFTNPAAKSAGYVVPNSPVAYSYPAQPKYVTGDLQTASAYARDGSVYVVKAPKQNVNVAQWNTNERYSLQPMKVVKEIKMPKLPNPAPMSATKEVKQSVEASIVAARKVADAKMIKQVQNAVRQQKIKTFLQGAIGKR